MFASASAHRSQLLPHTSPYTSFCKINLTAYTRASVSHFSRLPMRRGNRSNISPVKNEWFNLLFYLLIHFRKISSKEWLVAWLACFHTPPKWLSLAPHEELHTCLTIYILLYIYLVKMRRMARAKGELV